MAETSRKRWTIAGVFLGVGLIAWLASMGAGRLASSFLALPDDVDLTSYELGAPISGGAVADSGDGDSSSGTSRRPRRKSKRNYLDPILARNIFDSEAIGKEAEEDDGEFTGDGGAKSDLKVVLLATVVAEPESYSSALIAEEKGEGAFGYGVGDDLLGEGTIVKIEQKRVIIRRSNGEVEYIAMDGGTFEKKEGAGSSKEEDAGDDDIKKVGDNKFVVEQELVDKLLENPEKLYSQVRVVPHKGSDGEIDGYRMSGIRRKSFFSRLGIKNGDIVHAVNGKPLTSMSAAMDAYNSMQESKDFSFDLTRRNKKQTFEYEIR